MMNLIFWKKEAVAAGGCRCSRMSLGCGTVEHSGLERHSGLPQHSGSSQSVRPSASERNEGFLLFSEGVFQVGRGLALKGSFTQGGSFPSRLVSLHPSPPSKRFDKDFKVSFRHE